MSLHVVDPHVHHWHPRNTPRDVSPLVKLLGWHPRLMRWVAPKVFPGDAVQFFGKPDHLLTDYGPEEYLADTGSWEVSGYVHIEASWKGRGPMGPVDETRWIEGLDAPRIKGIVGQADLTLGEGVDTVLAAHVAASPRFRGVRNMLSNHPSSQILSGCERPGLVDDPAWRKGYALLARYGLSFDATVYQHQLGDIASLASDFPEIPLILCHIGTPPGLGGGYGGEGTTAKDREGITSAWKEGMHRLAEQPNVWVKISGVAMPVLGWGYHQRTTPPTAGSVAADIQPLVDFLIDTFGAERCMFASNFPIDKVSMPWTTLFEAFALTVAKRPDDQREALFAGTATRVYRLSV